ncbi:MAG: hypothetical protein LIR50_07825 [Bacillota bacterium]|nr:hypothetical protein [Bacillota bacterium]
MDNQSIFQIFEQELRKLNKKSSNAILEEDIQKIIKTFKHAYINSSDINDYDKLYKMLTKDYSSESE